MWDITSNTSYINRNLIIGDSNELNKKLESGGFFSNAVTQLFETGKSWVESKLERAILGNIYTYSLTRLEDQAKTLLNGGIMETANAITEYIDDRDQRNNKGRYHVPETIQENLFNNQIQPQSQINTQLGNIFKANTLINNI